MTEITKDTQRKKNNQHLERGKYFVVDWQVEEVVFPFEFEVDGFDEHILSVFVGDVPHHQSRFGWVDDVDVDVELARLAHVAVRACLGPGSF